MTIDPIQLMRIDAPSPRPSAVNTVDQHRFELTLADADARVASAPAAKHTDGSRRSDDQATSVGRDGHDRTRDSAHRTTADAAEPAVHDDAPGADAAEPATRDDAPGADAAPDETAEQDVSDHGVETVEHEQGSDAQRESQEVTDETGEAQLAEVAARAAAALNDVAVESPVADPQPGETGPVQTPDVVAGVPADGVEAANVNVQQSPQAQDQPIHGAHPATLEAQQPDVLSPIQQSGGGAATGFGEQMAGDLQRDADSAATTAPTPVVVQPETTDTTAGPTSVAVEPVTPPGAPPSASPFLSQLPSPMASPSASPPAAPAVSEIDVPLPNVDAGGDPANLARVVRGLRGAVNQNGGSVTLRLQPPEMGFVRIQMELHNGTVNATLHSEHASVRTLLSQHLAQLRHALENQGLSVERLHVQSLSSSQHPSGADQHDDSFRHAPDGRSRGEYAGRHGASDRQGESGDRERSDSFEQALLNEVA